MDMTRAEEWRRHESVIRRRVRPALITAIGGFLGGFLGWLIISFLMNLLGVNWHTYPALGTVWNIVTSAVVLVSLAVFGYATSSYFWSWWRTTDLSYRFRIPKR
jgi:ABC-type antimicrobial peptide transport system permease subunit